MLPRRLSYLSDLPGAGTLLCVERLWMIKLMVVGFCPIGLMLVQVVGVGFEKKSVLHSFGKVKGLQGYSKIGGWILTPARLTVRTA